MLDMSVIRTQPDLVRAALAARESKFDLDGLLALDAKRREMIGRGEALKAERNVNSKRVAEAKKKGEDAAAIIARTKAIGDEIKSIDAELAEAEARIQREVMLMPNLPAPDVPVGLPDQNKEVKHRGARKTFAFKAKTHYELGEALDILDFARATKIAEPHFSLFKRQGARLVRALVNFMLDLHTTEHGYVEVAPPYLVNRASMSGTGQLPKFEDDMYKLAADDLFLIPTAEVPVTNIHRDEILAEGDLPICYAAYSACFRREAGSYGKDTRGLMRVHQFDKVELVKFVEPEKSYDELESLLLDAEQIPRQLGLAHRVQLLCAGDMSFTSAKTYDIEAWAPGLERWMEISSCSNFEDFQARRANIRYRDKSGAVRFPHTLNGSGVALARTILAIIETYQQENGTIVVPEVLRPYMGGMEIIA